MLGKYLVSREIDRIEVVLDKVRQTWYSNPDMRLGQLLLNLESYYHTDLYHVEDDELVRRLEEVYD